MALDSNQKNFEDLTSTRTPSNKIGLGTIHEDLQGIRQDLSGQNFPNSGPVNPLLNLVPANQDLPQEADKPGILDQLKASAIMGIKEALGIDIAEDEDSAQVENQQIYDEFSKLVLQQQDLLLDATKEQTDIFKKLSDTIAQLKTSNKEDIAKLRKSIDDLAKKLKDTPDTQARRGMERAVIPQQTTSVPSTPTSNVVPFKSGVLAKSTAVPAPALALTAPVAANAALYEDAGLISSESEGDKVQTGERETDMATILGFLGNLFGGGDSSGPMMPFLPGRGTSTLPGKSGPPLSKPAGAPKTGGNWWDKFKKAGGRTAGSALGAAGMARMMGITGLFMPSELGNSDLRTAEEITSMQNNASSPDLAALEAEHKQIEKEMYDLVTTPAASEEQRNAADARINELNKAAAENVRKQNEIIKSAPKSVPGPMPATKPDSKIIEQSLQNRDLQTQQQATAPVIINNQQTVGNNTPPAYIAPSLEVRPKESALDRYINRQTVY